MPRKRSESPTTEPRIRLTLPKAPLKPGARTMVRVEVSRLKNVRHALSLRVENHSPEVLRLRGGEVQILTIDPKAVRGGVFVTEIPAAVVGAGDFLVVSLFGAGSGFFAHVASVS